MIKTMIVEDNPIARRFLEDMLTRDGRYQIEEVCEDAFEAEKHCYKKDLYLILMDVQTNRNHSGLAAAERIRDKYPDIKIVIVTSLVDPEVLERAKNGAADSLWYKDHGSEELLEVIEQTLAGKNIFPGSSPSVALKDIFSDELTPRQLDVLRCFVQGFTYDEIAEKLYLSKGGVRKVIERVMEKGGFENKYELFIALVENKLVVTSLLDEKE